MNYRITSVAFAAAFCTLFLAPEGAEAESPKPGADTWARFHGVEGQGLVAEGKIPQVWQDSDYAWRHKVSAFDVGSPVVHGGRVYFLSSEPKSQQISVQSLDVRTGKLRWAKKYDHPQHHLHKRNTYASSTPAVDDQHVFVAWSNPDHTYLKCFDHDGNEIWSRDFGTWQSQHGFGTSPRIFGSMVLLLNSQQGEQLKGGDLPGKSRVIAVDQASGDTVWETPLETTRVCYGVPAIYQANGKTQIIDANTGNGMFGLDPTSGKMLWNLKVFEMRVCCTPLIVGDIAISSSGSGGGGNHLVAVQIPKDASEQPKQLYRIDRGAPYVPTPVVKGDRLFMVDDKGIASCINAKTGEQLWMERIGGNFGASPIIVGDVMLMISLDGKATTVKASDEFQKLDSFDLGGPVGATPAYVNGRLLLRVGDEIRCLGGDAI
ncbi:MAG: PQQ-binding-like beta-propeller repeat protein [Rubripirellula sp.]